MPFDVYRVRPYFPGLLRLKNGKPVVFLDNPAGTQVPRVVAERMLEVMYRYNANLGGAFDTSVEAEGVVLAAHAAAAMFVNAISHEDVLFGQNMTTLTFAMSRAIANSWQVGDNIVLSRMDHDANITPWLMAAAERGVVVRWLEFNVESFEFDLANLEDILDDRTRLVAVCYASNVTGTVNDVTGLARLAHQVNAKVYVDAVQYAPHGAIDVQAINCDFLVCSAYKFFGPHYGLFWGRRECLDELTPYKVRASSNNLPWRFVTGTTNREQLAGVHAAIDYIRSLSSYADGNPEDPRAQLVAGYDAMRQHEEMLTLRLIDGLLSMRGVRILGISDTAAMSRRISTVSFVVDGLTSIEFSLGAAARGIQVRSGHNYAIELASRLGILSSGGGVRVGPVHYNTIDEIDQVVQLVDQLKHKGR